MSEVITLPMDVKLTDGAQVKVEGNYDGDAEGLNIVINGVALSGVMEFSLSVSRGKAMLTILRENKPFNRFTRERGHTMFSRLKWFTFQTEAEA